MQCKKVRRWEKRNGFEEYTAYCIRHNIYLTENDVENKNCDNLEGMERKCEYLVLIN